MLPTQNDHMPDHTPSADASADDRRHRDPNAAKSRTAEQQEMLAAELEGKRRAKKDPEARKSGTLTLDKRG